MRQSFVAAVVALVATLGSSTAPRAVTAAGGMELSRDGSSWGPTLDDPLLDEGAALVPGGALSATFRVRNSGADAAELTVAAVDLHDGGIDADLLSLEMEVAPSGTDAGASGSTRTFASLATDPDLAVATSLAAGAARQLTVTLRLGADAGNDSQRRTVSFALELRLRGSVTVVPAGPAPPGPPAGPAPPTSGLSTTGAAIATVLAVACGLLVAGTTTRRLARRRG